MLQHPNDSLADPPPGFRPLQKQKRKGVFRYALMLLCILFLVPVCTIYIIFRKKKSPVVIGTVIGAMELVVLVVWGLTAIVIIPFVHQLRTWQHIRSFETTAARTASA